MSRRSTTTTARPSARPGVAVRAHRVSVLAVVLVMAMTTTVLAAVTFAAPASAAAGDYGTPAQAVAGFASTTPTATKPESKLWFAQGSWWASMASIATGGYRIHRLDRATSTWVDTGVDLDPRGATQSDVLWNGTHLLVASHPVASSSTTTSTLEPARLFRYSWGGSAWTPDAGFPVDITGTSSESLTIAQADSGELWATWTLNKRIYVARTTGSADAASVTFGARALPSMVNLSAAESTAATTLKADDISTIASADGVTTLLWSNQATGQTWSARRADSAGGWTATLVQSGALMADDHVNLRTIPGDPARRVVAVLKTSRNDAAVPVATDPLLVAAVFTPATGTWTTATVATVGESATRPIAVVEPATGEVHVFYTGPSAAGVIAYEGTVYEKSAPLATLRFPVAGTPVIRDVSNATMNNATSAKLPATAASGVVVLAATGRTPRYWFAVDGGTAPPVVTAPAASFTASTTSGAAPVSVSFTDTSTGGPTSWAWTFGDGGTSTAANPSHTFATAGTFVVTMTASNVRGSTSASRTVQITSPVVTGAVVDRVNAGGAAQSGGWLTDTAASPSAWANGAAAQLAVGSTTTAVNVSDPSVPAGTPAALFQTMRYDQVGGEDMVWTMPVPSAGTYTVRLYFAETYWTTAGKRAFDVSINGTKVLSRFDIVAAAGGAKRGIVREFTVTTTAPIIISFGRVAGLNNPQVNAIEVLS